MFKIILVLGMASCYRIASGARILAIVPSPSYSHQTALWPIWKRLSSRGHDVTLITTDPDPQETNITQIDIGSIYGLLDRETFAETIEGNKNDLFKTMDFFFKSESIKTTGILTNDNVQRLMRGNDTFDVAIVEFLFASMFPFVEKFKVPFIGVTSLEPPDALLEILGNPSHPVLYPDILLPFNKNLTFFQRVVSCFTWAYLRYFLSIYRAQENRLTRKYFGEDYSPVGDIAERADLLLVNSNPIFGNVRPLVPSTIYIGGGLHIKEAKPLPVELQTFLDEAREGVIYFSLGSNVKSRNLSNRTKQVMMEAFAEMPYKVLWKFEAEELFGKPDNVKILKWLPQQDVLRHPNIKVFITQGGLQSIDEAIYNKVPMVGIPFYGDQQNNIKKVVEKGICLFIDRFHFEKDSFKATILEVIENSKYRKRVEELSDLILDQPMSGLEKAVWWTEYVIRHKGAKHLRSPAIDIPFYQYYLLDVISFFSAIFISLSFVAYKSLKLSRRFVKSINSKMFCTSKEKEL